MDTTPVITPVALATDSTAANSATQFDIASPQAVTGNELVGMLSKKLNREVRFTPLSSADAYMLHAVDEERRRALDAALLAARDVFFHTFSVSTCTHFVLQPPGIKSESRRVPGEMFVVETALALE